ncbi:MAG: DNA recombination protein RmuC, partial [Thermodesulfobacteriota bacterium]
MSVDSLLSLPFLFAVFAVVVFFVLFFIMLKTHDGLNKAVSALREEQKETKNLLRHEISQNRKETAEAGREERREQRRSLKEFGDSLLLRMTEIAGLQKNQLDTFARLLSDMTRINEEKLDMMRKSMEQNLHLLQEENSRKLEQMRETVDEKLQTSLEKRLSESFRQVGDRLEQVYKGLGEMRNLAAGVGDLKKVLTNVKTRGIWGEIQLGVIMEQILTPDQYELNVATKASSRERVEYAVKLPGRDSRADKGVYLPIDSKFPQEDYQRLLDAQDRSDKGGVESSIKNLELRIKNEAKAIRDKYIDPPNTTDFAVLFLPVEGLYAEVLRRPGLCEVLQREYRVMICGPTTLAALLN